MFVPRRSAAASPPPVSVSPLATLTSAAGRAAATPPEPESWSARQQSAAKNKKLRFSSSKCDNLSSIFEEHPLAVNNTIAWQWQESATFQCIG